MAHCTTVVINKSGSPKITNCGTTDSLYKLCNYRKNVNFQEEFVWEKCFADDTIYSVHLWGKTSGSKNTLNNLPELENATKKTFFGSIVFVFYDVENTGQNITLQTWQTFYDKHIGKTVPKNDCDSESTNSFSDSMSQHSLDDNISDDNNDSAVLIDASSCNIHKELTLEPYYFSSDNED